MTAIAHLTRQHIATADVPTRNGHIYPRAVLEPLTQLPPYSLHGYLGMAGGNVPLGDVSHVIASLSFEGSALYADIDILDTAAGHRLREWLRMDTICFRLDGYGVVRQASGALIVVEEYDVQAINAIPATEAT